MDGTCMLLSQEGHRQAMVGSLSRYDAQGQRQYTVYRGADPEYGKEPFLAHLERALAQVKARYPHATYVGVADGVADH